MGRIPGIEVLCQHGGEGSPEEEIFCLVLRTYCAGATGHSTFVRTTCSCMGTEPFLPPGRNDAITARLEGDKCREVRAGYPHPPKTTWCFIWYARIHVSQSQRYGGFPPGCPRAEW